MPIGLTPGFLSKAIKRQAKKGERISGDTKEVQIYLANRAIATHSSLEAE